MKILLNYLPPSRVEIASTGLSALKGYLIEKGVETTIIYWNILFHDLLNQFRPQSDITLAPFMYSLAEEAGDETAKKRILSYVQRVIPQYKFLDKGNYEDLLHSWQNGVRDLFAEKFDKIDLKQVSLFGFSIKHYQLIPGLVISRFLKQQYPGIKIVVGGVDDKDAAVAILKLSADFDFVIWGEGEIPLLKLYQQINSDNPALRRVPNLVFRDGGLACSSDAEIPPPVDLDKVYPDKFDDFLDYARAGNIENLVFPIEGSRGCYWGKCKFCLMNTGFRLRRRSRQSLLEEIKTLVNYYQIYNFRFPDNSANDASSNFDDILRSLIQLNEETGHRLRFAAEISPVNMTASRIKMMAEAGFKSIQIGFEGFCDEILEKVNKNHSYAENILFVKFALEYGIAVPGSHILTAYPDETEQDIFESMKNLHYFRFFLGRDNYRPNFVGVQLGRNAGYFKDVNNIEEYTYSPVDYYLPNGFIPAEDKLTLFAFVRNTKYRFLWDQMIAIHKYYLDNKIEYRLIYDDNGLHYFEYVNEKEVKKRTFAQPEYYHILKSLNHSILDFDNLHQIVLKDFPSMTTKELGDFLTTLNTEYLVYMDTERKKMVSVINTDNVIIN